MPPRPPISLLRIKDKYTVLKEVEHSCGRLRKL